MTTQELFDNLFIFEMANSHQGSVEHGIDIIREMGRIARRHNIRAAVKLQYRELDSFIHPDYKGRTDIKHIPRFESTRLMPEQFNRLVEAIREEGLIPMSKPFDDQSVDNIAPATASLSARGSVASGLDPNDVSAQPRSDSCVPACLVRQVPHCRKHIQTSIQALSPRVRLSISVSVGLRYSPLP